MIIDPPNPPNYCEHGNKDYQFCADCEDQLNIDDYLVDVDNEDDLL